MSYIKEIFSKFKYEQIKAILGKAKDCKVLVIGDTIIDQYTFVNIKGRAIKDPILSVGFINEEIYAGGIIALANHLSSFVSEVKLITLLGDQEICPDVNLIKIADSLKDNVKLKYFIKENSPTVIKKRFVDAYRKNKLFKIEYMNDTPLNIEITQEILQYLNEEIPKYDLVIVGDFGHGFINSAIRRKIEEKSKYLAVNVQSNSANMGFNYLTNYQKANFRTCDEVELRLPIAKRFISLEDVSHEISEKFNLKNFIVTQGNKGCIYYNEGKLIRAPIVINTVKDSVGAGDALFAITSLLAYLNVDPELLPFLGNCAGGMAANIMGNKESITKEGLLKFIEQLFKSVDEVEIGTYLKTVNNVLNNLNKSDVSSFTKTLLETYHNDGTIYIFGNGGSGATASHFAGDLVKGVSYGLDKRFRALCLNDNMPSLMAIANDISYDDIFVEPLKNFLNPNDLVIGISGSGNSMNVVKALHYAKERNIKTAAICGFKGGKIKEIADVSIHAEVDDMEITEDIHNLIMVHCVKRVLMNQLEYKNTGDSGNKYMERIE